MYLQYYRFCVSEYISPDNVEVNGKNPLCLFRSMASRGHGGSFNNIVFVWHIHKMIV